MAASVRSWHHRRTRRGTILILVLLATAAALALSTVLISKQVAMLTLSQSVAPGSQARAVAESGLELAISHIRSDAGWRDNFISGVWITDEPLYGGSFTLVGEDGEDTDGDGVVEGDSDLTDDDRDLVTLASTGTYDGVIHVARAVLVPSGTKEAILVVKDPANLSSEDLERTALMRSWGWVVSYADYETSKNDLTAAFSDVNVVYVPATIDSVPNGLKDALKISERGVVLEMKELVKHIELASSSSEPYLATQIEILELTELIEDDFGVEVLEVITHYITRTLTPGVVNVLTANDNLLEHRGTISDDVSILAKKSGDTEPTLLAVDNGGELDGHPAKGRRVALPWGKSDFSIVSLNSSGQLLLRRSLDWAGQTWKGPLPSIAVFDKVEVKGTGLVDSYDSTLGAYGGANVAAEATASTNSYKDRAIHVKDNGVFLGNVYVQQGSDPSKVVKVENSGVISGPTGVINVAVPIPLAEAPEIAPNLGNVTYSSGTTTINSSCTYGDLKVEGTAILQIDGEIQIVCTNNVTLQQSAQIQLLPGATLDIYTRQDVHVEDSAQVNVNTADPSVLTWHLVDKKLLLEGSSQMYGTVRGRMGTLEVKDDSTLHGTFQGKKCKVENGSFHVDTSLSGTPTTLGGGFVPLPDYAARWLE